MNIEIGDGKLLTDNHFREVKASSAFKEFVQFHSENKLLLMAYNQSELRIVGRIVANPEKRTFNEVISEYEKHLCKAFGRNRNILQT